MLYPVIKYVATALMVILCTDIQYADYFSDTQVISGKKKEPLEGSSENKMVGSFYWDSALRPSRICSNASISSTRSTSDFLNFKFRENDFCGC